MTALDLAASGLAAVWARENTREAIFDAMARKEVYGTSGTRLLVRVFAGWDFTAEDLERSDFAAQGYARGVPMGGDLKAAPAGKAPTFLIRALRDPDGANLDRVQVVKGWLDAKGKTHEKVYDVAWSRQTASRAARTGSCRRSATRSTSRTRPTRTRSARPYLAGALEGSRVRPEAARVLLRARDRDPDAALGRLRREVLQDRRCRRRCRHALAGARLHLADLVYAGLRLS